jgi:hypothetical protein
MSSGWATSGIDIHLDPAGAGVRAGLAVLA